MKKNSRQKMRQTIGYILLILSLIIPAFIEKMIQGKFVEERFLTIFFLLAFISICFIFEMKKLFEFYYKKRWFICIGVLLFVLLMGFNTSSVNCFDSYIQPNITSDNYKPIFNSSQSIRSDEWASGTPLKLSQYRTSKPLSTNNDLIMGKTSNVTFYPQYSNKSLSVLSNPRLWGGLVFDEARSVTVDTMFEWIVLFFVSFEFCLILTDKNKLLSLFGAIAITFAPAVVWWNAYNLPLFGEALVVLVYKFFKSNKNWQKILLSLIIGWVCSCDIMTMYPAWLVPYSYVFLGIIIWIFIKNMRKEDTKITIIGILLAIIVAALIILPNYFNSLDIFNIVSNTVYPGKRFSVGNDGMAYTLFNYIGSLFYWHRGLINSSEASQFIGFFPIPILLGIYYLVKSKIQKQKMDLLSLILIIISIIFTIDVLFKIPLLAKVTLLYMCPPVRITVIINYICLLLLLRIMAKNNTKILKKSKLIISGILGLIATFIAINIYKNHFESYFMGKIPYLAISLFLVLFILLIINHKKLNYIFISILSFVILVGSLQINPINVGVDILYEKPLAKEIRNIVEKDKKSIWATIGTSYVVNNYIVVNGGKTITSTNIYPNYNLWKKLDDYKKYDDVINRFAYFMCDFTEEKTFFYLNQADLVTLFINPKDVETLGIDYLVSLRELESYGNDDIRFEKVYFEDGMYIYHAKY